MRKTATSKKLREIEGGVCAPEGFKANGVHCGISRDSNKKDLAIVAADRRGPTACVFSEQSAQSAPARVSKKHLKRGIARAILINSGTANVFLEDGEWLAEKICRVLAKRSDIEVNETLLASTGKVGEPLYLTPFEEGIPKLIQGLSATAEGSLAAAEAIMTTDKAPRQVAFSFDLGDFPCKIGAIFKGTTQVCPNMATTIAVLTTDVNILPEMLQKALVSAVKDTFNLLCIDGISSPNDTICIMASGKAGNYRIFCEDSEYDKFLVALREALGEICRRLIVDSDENQRLLLCKVSGAKSKQAARAIAKRVACSQAVKSMLLNGNIEVINLLYEANVFAEDGNFAKARIAICDEEREYALFEDGRALRISEETARGLLEKKELTIRMELGNGNFGATSFTRL